MSSAPTPLVLLDMVPTFMAPLVVEHTSSRAGTRIRIA